MGRFKIKQEDGSVERVAYLSDVQEVADDLDDSIEELEQHKTDILSHLKDTMPHEFKDLQNNKIYRFGFQLSGEGNPQLIFKEVENV